jgi:hypothetical protein
MLTGSEKASKPRNDTMQCSECGCFADPSACFIYRHLTPTCPDDVDDLPRGRKSPSPPAMGPDGLQDNAAAGGEDAARPSPLQADIRPLQAGDFVELCFLITDRSASWVPPEDRSDLSAMLDRAETESMWVLVLNVKGKGAGATYRGELWNIPELIDPAKLRFGSPITFEARHIYDVAPSQ